MPVDCTGSLTADIIFDCINAPVGGIEQNVLLVKKEDINITSITTDEDNDLIVASLELNTGAHAYSLTGVKQSNGKAWELVKKENAPDKFKHTFSGVIFNPSADNKQQAAALAKGSKYVVLVEQVWKGAGSKDAFEILGLSSGLEIATMTNSSKENDNMIMFELSSADGFEEATMPKNFLDGTYAATKALFDNKLAPVTP